MSQNKEEIFIKIMSNVVKLNSPTLPNVIYWVKYREGDPNPIIIFNQDKKHKDLWVSYWHLWENIQLDFNLTYIETQLFIKEMMDKHYKLGYYIPDWDRKYYMLYL